MFPVFVKHQVAVFHASILIHHLPSLIGFLSFWTWIHPLGFALTFSDVVSQGLRDSTLTSLASPC